MTPALRLALALAPLVSACQPPPAGGDPAADAGVADAAPRKARGVTAETIQPRRFAEQLELTAEISAPDDATLSARGAGTVKAMAELGERVAAGQVVARLDAAAPEVAVAQARAGAAQAQASLDLAEELHRRQQPLHARKIISDLEFQQIIAQREQARAGIRQAEASVRAARTQVSFYEVVAPFAGTVEARLVEPGEQVNPGQPMLRIIDARRVRVRAGVPERFSGDVRVGSALEVRFNTYGLPPREARVVFVGGAIDPRSRTFIVEAELDNADGQLKPAMIARVALTRSTVEDALVVPQTAIVRDERGASLFVVRTDQRGPTVRLVPVEEGPASGNQVVIRTGLKAGDQVVTLGQSGLSDGDGVTLLPRAGETSASAAAASPPAPKAGSAP